MGLCQRYAEGRMWRALLKCADDSLDAKRSARQPIVMNDVTGASVRTSDQCTNIYMVFL